ncbi:MAG TPA: outer-membrane lipoprotein carrier protein LolA [Candidatus Hydrogenedentes bacterium]|nr:outer-membrane lipoprotein carrier protein LolA [Candidatus Hydrogenedentota bacterium]
MTLLTVAALALLGAGDPSFDQFFADFTKKRDGIEALEARFTQKSIVPEETLTTEGGLVYSKPRRIVFRTDSPNRATLIEESRVCEYEPEIKQLVIYDIEDNPRADVFFLGFDNDTENLRKSYEVSLFTTSEDPQGSRGLLVKPKKKEDEEPLFIEAKLYLRDKDYLPYRIQVINDKESQVDIAIKEYKVNVKLDPAKLQIAVPEGTKVIENDDVLETVGPEGKTYPDALRFSVSMPEEKPSSVQVKDLAPPAPEEAQKTP